jgi:hypothetical protein
MNRLANIAGIESCRIITKTAENETCLLKTETTAHWTDFQCLFSRPTIWMIVSRSNDHSVVINAFCGAEEATTSATDPINAERDISCRWGELHLSYGKNGTTLLKIGCNPFTSTELPQYFEARHATIINEIETALGLDHFDI